MSCETTYAGRFKKGFKRMTPEGVAKVKGAITRDMMRKMLKWGALKKGKKGFNIAESIRDLCCNTPVDCELVKSS